MCACSFYIGLNVDAATFRRVIALAR